MHPFLLYNFSMIQTLLHILSKSPLSSQYIFAMPLRLHTSISLFLLASYSPQLLLNINFSSRMTSMDVQRNLEANVEKRTKDSFGPPPGKRLIVFIDDMNMPQVCTGCVACIA